MAEFYYVPEFRANRSDDEHEDFHAVRASNDIYALCGKQVDNSLVDGQSPVRSRKPSNYFCIKCEKIIADERGETIEKKSDAETQPDRSGASQSPKSSNT